MLKNCHSFKTVMNKLVPITKCMQNTRNTNKDEYEYLIQN